MAVMVGASSIGNFVQPGVECVQKPGHLHWRFALDAHGDDKGTQFQVRHGAVQYLTHQVRGLGAVQRTGAVPAAANVLDVMFDARGRDCPGRLITIRYEFMGTRGDACRTRRCNCGTQEPQLVPHLSADCNADNRSGGAASQVRRKRSVATSVTLKQVQT